MGVHADSFRREDVRRGNGRDLVRERNRSGRRACFGRLVDAAWRPGGRRSGIVREVSGGHCFDRGRRWGRGPGGPLRPGGPRE